MLVLTIIGDLFRDKELSGWWKALWIIALIFVHAFYVAVVRPNADAVLTQQAIMQETNPEFVQETSLYVILKDYEQEAEIILMIEAVFRGLEITDYSIKINHRGILNGVAEQIGAKGKEVALFVAIDKLDKIGEEKVKEELTTKGFTDDQLTTL